MDTIFALATAQGKAGVAVVRVSGPRAFAACERMAGGVPKPRESSLRRLKGVDGSLLDEALILAFVAGHSFTGEDVVEFQLHGSIAVVRSVLATLGSFEGLRLADPGEFTRRALENDRLDVAQIEGLADLIEAESDAQRRQALRVFEGKLGDKAESWRRDLIRAAALIEATIDFADEEVPENVMPEVTELLGKVQASLQDEADGAIIAERIREGFEIAIVGAPNAGKSTLLNRLAGREAAITSEYAGTTRDIIEVRMDLAGLPVTLLDTAGLRDTVDPVEGIGIDRAVERATKADLRVFLMSDAALPLEPQKQDIVLQSKADLNSSDLPGISGKTGEGVDALIDAISSVLIERASGVKTATRERHRIAIEQGISGIQAAKRSLNSGPEFSDLAAEDIRTVVRSLDSLVGLVDVEHLLDEIFSSFCLGK
jgi:tRNA modification GTPase